MKKLKNSEKISYMLNYSNKNFFNEKNLNSKFVKSEDSVIDVNFNVKFVPGIDKKSYINLMNMDLKFNPTSHKTSNNLLKYIKEDYINKPTVLDVIDESTKKFGNFIKDKLVFDFEDTYMPKGVVISKYFDINNEITINSENYWEGYFWVIRVNGQDKQYVNGYNLTFADPNKLVEPIFRINDILLNNPVKNGFLQVNCVELSYEYFKITW